MAPSMLDQESQAASVPVQQRMRFERLLAELSARFINLPVADVDAEIVAALRRIVELLDVDRSQLIRFTPADGIAVTHSWAVSGVPAVAPRSLSGDFPWVGSRLLAGHAVVVPCVDDLPPEASVDRATWRRVGVRSNLTVPMRVAGRIEGALAFGCLRRERDWPEDLVARAGFLAEVFANALAHKRALEALDAAIAFERVVSEVLVALLTATSDEQDRVIENGLHEMAEVFGAQRATLWQRSGSGNEFTKTHRWLADGVAAPPDSTRDVAMPWIRAQLVAGSIVRFARHADLPAEAAGDLPALRALDVRAAVVVPLMVGGVVVGALSFAAARDDRDWPEALVPRVKLVGELFATTLARHAAERREREAQAQAAHAARVGTIGVVAASLVHELTQPLAASLANAETAAELLAAPSPDLAELRAAVADIVADDRRLGELIAQLRRFLRRGEVERTELDLRETIDEVLRLAGKDAAEKGITITLDVADSLPKVVGDRVQVQQVMLNLLLNGIDAAAANAPGSRRVDVIAHPAAAGVAVEVNDTGPGMDEQTQTRIFQPFFTTKPGGMGLGLSISRSILAAHGGTLTVRSAPGRGSTFRFELPARQPGELRPAVPAQASDHTGGTVFVIDDDPSMRRALERQLQGAGYRVETFASASAYLERVPEAGIACIVSDVRMPGLSGLDLQTSLARANRDLPMVFVSGHGDVPSTVQALKAGAVNFLSKPFTKRDLLSAVAEGLARGRSLDSARRKSADLEARYGSLTPREREVFALVATGLLNKVIADRLGAAEATVKIHRGRVMEKMGADSVADLVRMAGSLGVPASAAPNRDGAAPPAP